MSASDVVLEAAIAYAERGWAVFPAFGIVEGRCTCGRRQGCAPGKHPHTRDGIHSATTDLVRIRAWGDRWQLSNLAIRTGEVSGLVVLDVDGPAGKESLGSLERQHAPLPMTLEVATGGGGRHLYFAHPGYPVKSSVARLGRGLDIRADGACVIAPPSLHVSGRTYRWKAAQEPDAILLARSPEWLLAHLETTQPPGRAGPALGELIPEGARNQELASLAGSLRRRGMAVEEIEAALMAVNERRCRPSLSVHEIGAIARSIGRYPPRATPSRPAQPPGTTSGTETAAPLLVRLSQIEPAPVRWLWPKRIPIGKLTLVAGDPGLGKSLLTLDIAARVSTGAPWPDGSERSEPRSVILLSAEDDAGDTLRPRLDAAGADVDRIDLLLAIQDGEKERAFNLASDLAQLEAAIDRTSGTALVVIDPVSAYLGGVDSHANAEVRSILAPLARLASTRRLAVVAVTHLRKSPGKAIYRAMGSLAFAAAARAVWGVTKDEADEKRRLFVPVKANLGPDAGGLAYAVREEDGQPSIAWEPTLIPGDADQHMGTRSAGHDAADEAIEFLRTLLAQGPLPVRVVEREGREAGFSISALRRGRARLELRPYKDGYQGRWLLGLPKGAHDE